MKTLSIFVDVQNVYYTTRSAYRKNFDYNAFWAEATQGYEVKYAFAYAVERGDEKQRQFQNILRAIGFDVKLKPFIQRADGSAKGDWDVGITIDMMDYARKTDRAILVSGDGDFGILVEKITQDFETPVDVYGVPKLTAANLVNAATHFRPIEHGLLL